MPSIAVIQHLPATASNSLGCGSLSLYHYHHKTKTTCSTSWLFTLSIFSLTSFLLSHLIHSLPRSYTKSLSGIMTSPSKDSNISQTPSGSPVIDATIFLTSIPHTHCPHFLLTQLASLPHHSTHLHPASSTI